MEHAAPRWCSTPDALYALAEEPGELASPQRADGADAAPGGDGAVLGCATNVVQDVREKLSGALRGQTWGVVLVLKGHRTLVTDGRRL